MGGSKGVVACPRSSSASELALLIWMGAGLAKSPIPSSKAFRVGEGGRWLSCFDIALSAGLTRSEEAAELSRERIGSVGVMIESFGLAPVLVIHFFPKEGNRLPKRGLRPSTGESLDLCCLADDRAERLPGLFLGIHWLCSSCKRKCSRELRI